MPKNDEHEPKVGLRANPKVSRRGFLKLGVAGISASALLFAAGCLGEQEDDDDDEGGGDDD